MLKSRSTLETSEGGLAFAVAAITAEQSTPVIAPQSTRAGDEFHTRSLHLPGGLQ
jgi:hypothetical protein